MKRISYLLFALMFVATISKAQTATDFTATDCGSVSHNLFTELNSGKVIVLVWVMPCSSCISAAVSTSNVVQSYQSSYPNRVKMYLCDDVGDTPCSSINAWAMTNSVSYHSSFSNSVINMADYGTAGMPKIVVIGGTDHHVYYNANFSVNVTTLQTAITDALSAVGIDELDNGISSININPNPATNISTVTFSLDKTAEVKAELVNIDGQVVKTIFNGKVAQGINKIMLDLHTVASGIYFAKFSIGDKSKIIKVVVAN